MSRLTRKTGLKPFFVFAFSLLTITGHAQERTPRAPTDPWGVQDIDDYTQWKQALGTNTSADPSTFLVPEGFQIELLRSAQENEGSWIAVTFDPHGRLTVAREDRGLLRMTLPKERGQPLQVETIEDTLKECRGLIYAYDALYVNANESKGMYRLRDTDGDDKFDEVKLLYASSGSTGHGRNGLALGPDGMIYSIHGDAVDLPSNFDDLTSPFREHRRGARSKEGHLIRTDRDGKTWQLVAAGLRNPYGLDFNTDGELFTYDADAEHDMGSPWYRPTRVVHLVAGADYGWRGVTGSWPPYYPDHPDNALPSVDIGKGSPTGVKFGTKSNFPLKYKSALFILDWAYGRIVAVHLTPNGAGYTGHAETFVKGRPFNVTDLAFGPDGAMYVVTGGRKTQSGLYRISYVGPHVLEVEPMREELQALERVMNARDIRRKLTSLSTAPNPQTLEAALRNLDSSDSSIRYAARIAIERMPVETWQQRALAETRPTADVTVLSALARSGPGPFRERIIARLNELQLRVFSTEQKLIALHAYVLCLTQLDGIKPEIAAQTIARLDPLFPDESSPPEQAAPVNRELCRVLVMLNAPNIVRRTLRCVDIAATQADQMHYLFLLRNVRDGWTREDRATYFHLLREMDRFQGGEGMLKFIRQIRTEALASLPEAERSTYAAILEPPKTVTVEQLPPRPFVREWKPEEISDTLADVGRGRDLARGKAMYTAALCVRCHRFGSEGSAIGPDLTAVARRFSRRDMLESILNPSKVVAEQYRTLQVVTTDGRTLSGRVVLEGDYRSPTLRLSTNPLVPEQITEIPKDKIESHTISPVSVMPQGLLNTLSREEILDLLAYLETGGIVTSAVSSSPK